MPDIVNRLKYPLFGMDTTERLLIQDSLVEIERLRDENAALRSQLDRAHQFGNVHVCRDETYEALHDAKRRIEELENQVEDKGD